MAHLSFTRDDLKSVPLKARIRAGKEVIREAFEENDPENMAIGFTGGKDSTLTAWLVKQVCEEEGYDKPQFMFVDHDQHFNQIEEYVEDIADEWGFTVTIAKNEDLIDSAEEPGDRVPLEELNERNREEVKRMQEDAEEAPFELDTEIGNHLLKTVPMNQFIEDNDITAVINGVRWDEHESRADEDFFSPRDSPEHTRVHPILHFEERDVWEATWFHMVPDTVDMKQLKEFPREPSHLPQDIELEDLPIAPKYWKGFRSLGSETGTDKTSDKAAWLQDLDNTSERAGRAQNKDDDEIMNRLRRAGYMIVFASVFGACAVV